MDFFGAQDVALKRSRRLVLLFGAAVLSMIAVVYFSALFLFGMTGVSIGGGLAGGWLHPELLGGVALSMGALIGGGSAFRTAQLRKGGGAVARLLGGRPLEGTSADAGERRFRNVVEEMSIAAGIPVPEIYILEGESGINAFAAGNSIHDAAVAVTRGALEQLDRDELQGVVAHEFSHILNGDMRLNIRLIGVLFGILLLTVIGRGVLRSSGGRGSRKGGGQVAIFGLVLLLLGYLGVLFGRIIQSAVSRQREFLADAAAVQFTRNPAGIAGALRKIGGDSGSRIANHHADEVGHLFFANGIRGALSNLFATHPPLEERIRRLEPGSQGRLDPTGAGSPAVPPAAPQRRSGRKGSKSDRRGFPNFGALPFPFPFPAAGLMAGVGSPTLQNLETARTILARVPDSLRTSVRDPGGATDLLLALLLDEDRPLRERQLAKIREGMGDAGAERADGIRQEIVQLGAAARLPLLDLALPALRVLPEGERQKLTALAMVLIRADGRVHPFEFALLHILRRNLPPPGADSGDQRSRTRTLSRSRAEAEILLSALAWAGAEDEAAAQHAFAAGASHLFPPPGGGWKPRNAEAVGMEEVDRALDRLQGLAPLDLRRLLEGAHATIGADRRLTVEEVELFRAVAEALDAPVPPLPLDRPDHVEDREVHRDDHPSDHDA